MPLRKVHRILYTTAATPARTPKGTLDPQVGDVVEFVLDSTGFFQTREVEEVKGQFITCAALRSTAGKVLEKSCLVAFTEVTKLIRAFEEEIPEEVPLVEEETPEPPVAATEEETPVPVEVVAPVVEEPLPRRGRKKKGPVVVVTEPQIWEEDDDSPLAGISPPGSSRPCT